MTEPSAEYVPSPLTPQQIERNIVELLDQLMFQQADLEEFWAQAEALQRTLAHCRQIFEKELLPAVERAWKQAQDRSFEFVPDKAIRQEEGGFYAKPDRNVSDLSGPP